MLLQNILIFSFLFSALHSLPLSLSLSLCYLIFSALFFSQNFLYFFSNFSLKFFSFSSQIFSLFLLKIFFVMLGSLLLPYGWGCGCGCGGSCHVYGCGASSTSWSCRGCGRSLVSGHAMGVGLCRRVRGSCRGGSSVLWFCGSCHGVCVVDHQCRGHTVGVGGHQFRVMPWVWGCAVGFVGHAMVDLTWVFLLWLCVDFLGLGCYGFYFCGYGLIFLGSCGLILVIVVVVGVGCVWWWWWWWWWAL